MNHSTGRQNMTNQINKTNDEISFMPEYQLVQKAKMPNEANNICALWYSSKVLNTNISSIKNLINANDFVKLPSNTQMYLNTQSKFNTLPEFGKNTAYDLVFKPIIEMYQNKAGIQAKSIVSPIRSKIQNSK